MSSSHHSSSQANHQPQSLLLSTTAEIRLTVWSFAIPSGERLVLDSKDVERWNPFERTDYATALFVMLTCKQASAEVLPILYSRNTVAIGVPEIHSNVLDGLPKVALRNISSLELGLRRSLKEVCSLWGTLMRELDSLKHLKLNLQDTEKWLRDAIRVAIYCMKMEDVCLKLELSLILWSGTRPFLNSKSIQYQFVEAEYHSNLYKLTFPDTVRNVTVVAEVVPRAAAALEDFAYFDWFFLRDKSKDTHDCKTFVWYGDSIKTKHESLEQKLKRAQSKHAHLKSPEQAT